jgi:hypothetical protein
MATFTAIKASDAPTPAAPRSPLSARMAQYEGFVNGIKRGQVGKLSLTSGETERGVILRVRRAGKRLGKDVDAWSIDGAVYFRAI